MNAADPSLLGAAMVASDLTLRPLASNDEAALARAFGDDELWTWMLVPPPRTPEAVRAWLDDALARAARGEQMPFVAVTPDGELAGTSRFLTVRPQDRGVEIGWTMFFANARGGWINGRAKLLMLGRAFDSGFTRVEIKTDARNARSRAAILAVGATFEGILRGYQRRADGTQRDTAMYSVLANEWPNVREALERRTRDRKGA